MADISAVTNGAKGCPILSGHVNFVPHGMSLYRGDFPMISLYMSKLNSNVFSTLMQRRQSYRQPLQALNNRRGCFSPSPTLNRDHLDDLQVY